VIIANLTDADIKKIVSTSVEMLERGDFPDMRLENDGPDWCEASFITERSANLEWWAKNGFKIAD